MNDELPTEERLRRIERGVERRIGLRRSIAQRVAVGAAAVLLVVGGAALLRPVVSLSTSSGGSAAGSAASAPESGSATSATVAIECHGARTVTARADRSGLPASALAACALAERAGATNQHAASGTGASATPQPSTTSSTLCRTKEGALHVYPGLPSVCAANGMAPYPG